MRWRSGSSSRHCRSSTESKQRMRLWDGLCYLLFYSSFLFFFSSSFFLLVGGFWFVLFLRILSVAHLEIFQKWTWHPSLFLFFTLTHWSKTRKTHMQSIKPKENKTRKRQQVKRREVDISWSSSSCTHSQRIIWHIHTKGTQYECNVRFHFQFLQNDMVTLREKWNGLDIRGKCRVILSLLVVNVSHLGCSHAWDTLLGKEN